MPTADMLDVRIRSLVTELIESAPPAPVLPQLDWETAPASAPHRSPRGPGPVRVVVSAVVVLGALAAIAAVVAVGPRSRPTAVPGRSHHLRLSDQPPAAVTGNEQTIRAVPVPAFFNPGQSSVPDCWVSAGRVLAFSVEGSPTLVSWARVGDAPTTFRCPSGQNPPLTYAGSGLEDGTGTTLVPITEALAGSPTSVFVVAHWPAAATAVDVWNGLPADVAYVTDSLPGSTSYWEEPDGGVAAFLVPQLPDNVGLHAPDATASPVLRAYDTDGTLIGSVDAST
jgi:hypothetical protein